ncbi:MAG: D-alanyl-D-alanine carboxypeptidase, partial [Lachnospiraceae bacterium]|nr:D-alanyl-D-alanine carboxypeptidase [Lachnospiraceae bacterium]
MNNKFIKKTISLYILIALLIPTLFKFTYADPVPFQYCEDEITANAAIVLDANSSFVLYEKNADTKLYPASLTKIMTFAIVMEKTGGNLDDMVNFSYNAVTKDLDRESATIGASAGDQLSVKDCLYSLLLPSANDVANALAEHIAGSVKDFALLMNERAESIGCTNTNFVNPSGLHDDNQWTTANDMAKIIQYAMSYPMFSQISSSVSYRHAPIRRYKNPDNSNNLVLNTNSIMVPGSGYYYNGITSGKTGHTSLAGYNLAASARKHDMDLICVLLGCKSEK